MDNGQRIVDFRLMIIELVFR